MTRENVDCRFADSFTVDIFSGALRIVFHARKERCVSKARNTTVCQERTVMAQVRRIPILFRSCSVPFRFVSFCSVPFRFVLFCSVPFCSVPFCSPLFHSFLFHAILFICISFQSVLMYIPFNFQSVKCIPSISSSTRRISTGFPCKICPPGSYNNQSRAETCHCCLDGYSSTVMKTSCKPCISTERAFHRTFPNCSFCQTCSSEAECK